MGESLGTHTSEVEAVDTCGICGIEFSKDEFDKHIFHYKDERWCGVLVLRAIEGNPELAEKVSDVRKAFRRTP